MKKDLDDLMKEWDRKEAPVFQDKEIVKQAVLDRLADVEITKVEHTSIIKRLPIRTLVAACVFLVAYLFFIPKGNTEVSAEQVATISLKDIQELRIVVDEINSLFPEGVSWIAKDGDKLEIKTPEIKLESKNQIAIRYVVLVKKGSTWKHVHMTDIVTSPGEMIELAGTTKGHIWTHEVDSGVLALDSNLEFMIDKEKTRVNFSSGVEEGVGTEVKSLSINGEQYKIFQLVLKV
jgi:hypothetical protein